MRLLSLTDHQMSLVRRAASALPISERDEFLRGVAHRLGGEPTDDAISAAIDAQLALNRLPTFLCDSKPQEKTT
jgi:hypothetical protein